MFAQNFFSYLFSFFLSASLGFVAPSKAQANEYLTQELNHLQGAIANADNLDNYIREEDFNSYLEFIENIANCKYSSDCKNAGEAAHLLGLVFSHGTFGPAEFEKAEQYLRIAVNKYQKYDAANYLGWLYLDHPLMSHELNAFSYFQLAFAKGGPSTKSNAANFIGNYFLLSRHSQNFNKAARYYMTSVDISVENKISNSFLAAENLSRMLLYGNGLFLRDLEKAKYFSEISIKNGGHQLFKRIIEDFPIDASTTHRSILIWLEELAASGKTEALLELAYYNEFSKQGDDYLKWYNLCSIICDKNYRKISNDKLARYQQSFGSNVLNFAKKQAGEWFASRYRPATVVRENKPKSESGLEKAGDFHVLLIGVNDYSHPSWPTLISPEADVKLLSGILERQHGSA